MNVFRILKGGRFFIVAVVCSVAVAALFVAVESRRRRSVSRDLMAFGATSRTVDAPGSIAGALLGKSDGRRIVCYLEVPAKSAAAALAAAGDLSQLFEITLNGGEIDAELIHALRIAAQLERLTFRDCLVKSHAVSGISELRTVKWLKFANCAFDHKAQLFEELPINIVELFCENLTLADADLARVGRLSNLVYLSLDGNPVSGKCLGGFERLPKLRSLDVSRTHFDWRGIRECCSRMHLSSVFASGIDITPAELRSLKTEFPNVKIKSDLFDRQQALSDGFKQRLVEASQRKSPGMLDRVLVDVDLALANDSENPELYAIRGIAHEKLQQWRDAVDDFSRSIDIEREPKYLRARAGAYAKLHRDIECLRDIDEALGKANAKRIPAAADIPLLKLRIILHMESHDPRTAMLDCEAIVRANPNDVGAWISYAEANFAIEHWRSCIENCNRALAINPRAIEALNFRAQANEKLGMRQLADADREQIARFKSRAVPVPPKNQSEEKAIPSRLEFVMSAARSSI